jgi:hypothetical protein
MTTMLNKAVKRKSVGYHRGRRFIVTLAPGDVIGFRAERMRKTFYTTLSACYDMAVRLHVFELKRLHKKEKR